MQTTIRLPAARSERVVAALTAAALIPVWIFRYFPTQDGPSHLYNAFVLARYGSSPLVQQFFALNLRPFPNWTTYLLMAPLARVLPPLVVLQIVISLCVIAIPASVLYLQKSFKEETDGMVLLAVMLAYSYFLFLGFFNFILGSALFAVTVGAWRRGVSIIAVYALLALTYFTHAMPFAAAVFAVALLAAIEKRWRTWLELIPAFAVVAIDALGRIGAEREYRSFVWHLRNLLDLRPLVFFGDAHVWIARLTLAALIAAIVWTRKRNAMAWVTLAFLIAYFVAPWGYGAGGWALGGWINDRLLFLALLTVPAWAGLPRRALWAATAVVVVHFAVTVFEIARIAPQIESVARAASLVRPHSTLQTLGASGTTLHVASYLALRDDVVNLDDYEAHLRDFPLTFKPGAPSRPPDYLLVWKDAHVRNVAGYRVLYATNDIRLFSRAGL